MDDLKEFLDKSFQEDEPAKEWNFKNLVKPHPDVRKLIHSQDGRRFNLSSIKTFFVSANQKYCKWCREEPTKSKRSMYCSDLCASSAWLYCNPAKQVDRILKHQGNKCASCDFDYSPGWAYDEKGLTDWDYQQKHRPEVDHIVPIYKGGSAFDPKNLQVLCRNCHKEKTKIDLRRDK